MLKEKAGLYKGEKGATELENTGRIPACRGINSMRLGPRCAADDGAWDPLLDSNDIREVVYPRPMESIFRLSAVETMAEPYSPDNVDVGSDSGQKMPSERN
jgi:hypothetical protein